MPPGASQHSNTHVVCICPARVAVDKIGAWRAPVDNGRPNSVRAALARATAKSAPRLDLRCPPARRAKPAAVGGCWSLINRSGNRTQHPDDKPVGSCAAEGQTKAGSAQRIGNNEAGSVDNGDRVHRKCQTCSNIPTLPSARAMLTRTPGRVAPAYQAFPRIAKPRAILPIDRTSIHVLAAETLAAFVTWLRRRRLLAPLRLWSVFRPAAAARWFQTCFSFWRAGLPLRDEHRRRCE